MYFNCKGQFFKDFLFNINITNLSGHVGNVINVSHVEPETNIYQTNVVFQQYAAISLHGTSSSPMKKLYFCPTLNFSKITCFVTGSHNVHIINSNKYSLKKNNHWKLVKFFWISLISNGIKSMNFELYLERKTIFFGVVFWILIQWTYAVFHNFCNVRHFDISTFRHFGISSDRMHL